MTITVTDDLIRAVTTKDKALSDGRTLVKKGAYKSLHATADKSLLWGECAGSGANPYVLSVDLAGETPVIRCTCPVKPPPCKHTLGLLVAFSEKPTAFATAEAPAELVGKREKIQERAEKKAESAAKPKEVNKAALAKKTKVQRDALDLLEQLVLDTAGAGLGNVDQAKGEALIAQARQMNDAYLPGAAEALRRLAALAQRRGADEADAFYQLQEPGWDLPDALRLRLMQRHLNRLWAMVRKGQKVLDERLEEGESDREADAVVEDLLGRIWDLAGLKAKGYAKQNLRLFELADERWSDQVKEERLEQGWLLDLDGGHIHVDRRFRPFAAQDKIKERDSYEKPFSITEAGIYPGFVNRRIRWEVAALTTRAVTLDDFAAIHARAHPALDIALAAYKDQIKNPLASDEAVVLVRAAELRQGGDALVLVDAKGGTLVLRDPPLARYRTTNNCAMAAGAASAAITSGQPISLLLRMYLGLSDDAIYGQALALVVGTTHIRLGM